MSDLSTMIEETEQQIQELTRFKSESKLPQNQKFLQTEINRLTIVKENYEKAIKKNSDSSSTNKVSVSNYMWDQTKEVVKIYIEIDKSEKINPSEIHLEFDSDKKFTCIFGKYSFQLSNLFGAVNKEKCKAIITKSNRLVITLQKLQFENWSSLQKDNKMAKLNEDLEDLGASGNGDNLMNLMKMLYDSGDDEMKRKMAKEMYLARQGDRFKE